MISQWFPNDFPWHTVSHNQRVQRLDGWWVLLAAQNQQRLLTSCRRPESTRIDQIWIRKWLLPGYYLVIAWLFHLFPSDVYRKIYALLSVNQSASNFRHMAPLIWSAPRLNRKYTWLSLKIFNLLVYFHVFSTCLNSTNINVAFLENSWNKVNWPWRFGDDSSRYEKPPPASRGHAS